MRLDGSLRGTQFERNRLVELAANHQGKDLMLPRREGSHQRAHGGEPIMLFTLLLIARQGPLDGFEQDFLGYWFCQEVFSTGLDGTHARWNIPVPRQEDDRQ